MCVKCLSQERLFEGIKVFEWPPSPELECPSCKKTGKICIRESSFDLGHEGIVIRRIYSVCNSCESKSPPMIIGGGGSQEKSDASHMN
jgi:C4-type Zn-finger protein